MIQLAPEALTTREIRVEEIVVLRQRWEKAIRFNYLHGRPDHGLIWVRDGTFTIVEPDGTRLVLRPGELAYTPRGSRYTAEFCAHPPFTENTLIHFQLYEETGTPVTLATRPEVWVRGGGVRWQEAFERAETDFNAVRGRLRLKAGVCELLDRLIAERSPRTEESRLIRPGLVLLEEHLSEAIPVGELARASCVSERTFRRIFQRCTGMSPVQYRNSLRIKRARQWLSTGEMTVAEVAERLGFYDSAYFCRCFRRETGQLPGAYMGRPEEPVDANREKGPSGTGQPV